MTARHLGIIFQKLGIHQKRPTTKKGGYRRYWDAQDLLRQLCVYAIVIIDNEKDFELNPCITGQYSNDKNLSSVYLNGSSNDNVAPLDDPNYYYKHFPSLPPFEKNQLKYWDEEWERRYNKSFTPTFKVAELIIKDSDLEVAPSLSSHCYIFKYNASEKGYGSITNQYLEKAFPNQGVRHQDLGATNACRIVAMASNPEVNWILRDQGNPGYECHHICFNSSCVSPQHLQVLTPNMHKQVHAFKKRASEERLTAFIINEKRRYNVSVSVA